MIVIDYEQRLRLTRRRIAGEAVMAVMSAVAYSFVGAPLSVSALALLANAWVWAWLVGRSAAIYRTLRRNADLYSALAERERAIGLRVIAISNGKDTVWPWARGCDPPELS